MESHKLGLRVEKLEAFQHFLSAAKSEIRYSALPVEEILRKHSEGIEFFSLIPKKTSGESWAESWDRAVRAGAAREGFSPKDFKLLTGFGEEFGSSDTAGQIAHFNLYESLVSSALEEAKGERNRKSKLYRMLGIFGGTAAAILLC